MPKFVTSKILQKAKAEAVKKKSTELVKEIGFEIINEGKCVRIMHVGPYSTESESLSKMRKMMEKRNLVENVFTMKFIFLIQDECLEKK